MKEYNISFFGLFENVFKCLHEHYGEDTALSLFREIMETGLGKAYGTNFIHGSSNEFMRLVGDRDNNVGLRVSFPVVNEHEVVYQFHDDPFPGLNGLIDKEKLLDTYMSFKVKAILGDSWSYKLTKHLWSGDEVTEVVISKKAH